MPRRHTPSRPRNKYTKETDCTMAALCTFNIAIFIGLIILLMGICFKTLVPLIFGSIMVPLSTFAYFYFAFHRDLYKALCNHVDIDQFCNILETHFKSKANYFVKIENYPRRDQCCRCSSKFLHEVSYADWKDTSGRCDLDLVLEKCRNSEKNVLMHLKIEFVNAGDGTDFDLNKKAEEYKMQHNTDGGQRISICPKMKNFHKCIMLKLKKDENPGYLTKFWYIFWTIIPFHAIYDCCISNNYTEDGFIIKKLISTKGNIGVSYNPDTAPYIQISGKTRGNTDGFEIKIDDHK